MDSIREISGWRQMSMSIFEEEDHFRHDSSIDEIDNDDLEQRTDSSLTEESNGTTDLGREKMDRGGED